MKILCKWFGHRWIYFHSAITGFEKDFKTCTRCFRVEATRAGTSVLVYSRDEDEDEIFYH